MVGMVVVTNFHCPFDCLYTGHVEYPFSFFAVGQDIEPTTEWPMIDQGNLQLSISREQHGHEY
jgi:hypothetical protein